MKKMSRFFKIFALTASLILSCVVTVNAQHAVNKGVLVQPRNHSVNNFETATAIDPSLNTDANKIVPQSVQKNVTSFCGGDGTTPGTAYLICDTAQLAYLAHMVNSGQAPNRYAGYYFKLVNNLDLSGWGGATGWIPIGNDVGTSFLGNFDGDGHVISNLRIHITGSSTFVLGHGLFGVTGNQQYSPVISNLGLTDVDIYSQEDAYTGGLIGQALSSTITNCYATGKVNGYYSGGLIGYTYLSAISNCYSHSYVIARGNICAGGGLIGQNGISRYAGSSVTNCYSYSTVTSEGRGGGLIGYSRNSTTDKCYSMGTVTTSGSNSEAGGLIGFGATLSNSVAITSNVNGAYSGRVASYANPATNCYAYANMIKTGVCDGCVSGTDATLATLQTQDLYATTLGWNFTPTTGIWNVKTGKSHPYFQWQSAPAYNVSATTSSISFYLNNDADSVTVYKNGAKSSTFTSNLLAGQNTSPYTSNQNDALLIVVYEHGKIISYPVQVPRAHTIVATAEIGGTITPSGNVTVLHGADQTFTFTANTGSLISQVLIDGINDEAVVAAGTYTFANVTENHSITITYERVPHTILATAGANGTISPSGTVTVLHGDNKTFSFAPNLHYKVLRVLVDGEYAAGEVPSYTLTNITGSHTIHVDFTLIKHNIAASVSGSNGRISPEGNVMVSEGSSKEFTILPNANYKVKEVWVDGSNVGSVASYLFTNVTGDHSIVASFERVQYTVTASSNTGGTITPTGNSVVNAGDDKAYSITPNATYKIKDVLVDGVSVGAIVAYTFANVQANHRIEAQFEKILVGIGDPTDAALKVYPNPTHGALKVESGKLKSDKVQLFDLLGKKVLETTETEFSIAHLPAGIYILKIGEQTVRVVKN